ncbi:alpha-galactosidase [Vibrio sp. H11]|uniref:glycoside hydrolase family 36 protein n=1 Tax=Vibrio sp. H11 TaxID=2565928 RepID=UPI0010A5D231|nr:alpha-galactosidase [Vibrio sp. H11]
MTLLTLDNLREVEILQPRDTEVSRHYNELSFSYQGPLTRVMAEVFPLCRTVLDIEPGARIYGDGFQMLSQTAGTISAVEEVGRCPDNGQLYHLYAERLPKRFYNYLVIESANGYLLFGFSSCRRFAGYFELSMLNGHYCVTAYLDGEMSPPRYWAFNALESVVMLEAESLAGLFNDYARYLRLHHGCRPHCDANAPQGWCSWPAYATDASEPRIIANADRMTAGLDSLEWVVIDDGYQKYMGDWLSPSTRYPGGIRALTEKLRRRGKRVGIWLAPFIAEADSCLFRAHPEWFVRHYDGTLLKAEDVTYGGWRRTPWYILDCSNPYVRQYLTRVVRTMREEWGIGLFKLDAGYWGALKGKRFRPGITGVEAYRLGLRAIAQGAGDAWLLGCNAPMWPSLGLVDAMRIADDVDRNIDRFSQLARQIFYRSWQHRVLWQIDPDCLTLTSLPGQEVSKAAYHFHRDVLLASGGLLLSGDRLPEAEEFTRHSLEKLIARQRMCQRSAAMSCLSLNHAFLHLTEVSDLHCLFNYGAEARDFTLVADSPVYWYDFWSGERLCKEARKVLPITLPAGIASRAIVTAC